MGKAQKTQIWKAWTPEKEAQQRKVRERKKKNIKYANIAKARHDKRFSDSRSQSGGNERRRWGEAPEVDTKSDKKKGPPEIKFKNRLQPKKKNRH